MYIHSQLAACAFVLIAPAAFAQQAPRTPTFAQPVDPATLADQRGGDGTFDNTVDITVDVTVDVNGTVDGNTAIGTIAGNNLIDGGSFANNAGIATVIQNSGANVLIQNGMAVSVQFIDMGGATPP